jgi:hypothetical protein
MLHLVIFYMPQICDMGPMALLPLWRKACWGFFCPETSWWLRPGLNPRTWVLKGSMLPLDHRSHSVLRYNHTYEMTWQLMHIMNCTNRRVGSVNIQHLYMYKPRNAPNMQLTIQSSPLYTTQIQKGAEVDYITASSQHQHIKPPQLNKKTHDHQGVWTIWALRGPICQHTWLQVWAPHLQLT